MFRMRRYRNFLVFAIIATAALYHFTSLTELENAGAASVEGLKSFGGSRKSPSSIPPTSDSTSRDMSDSTEPDALIAVPSLVDSGKSKTALSAVKEPPTAKETSLTKAPVKDAASKHDDHLTSGETNSASKDEVNPGSPGQDKSHSAQEKSTPESKSAISPNDGKPDTPVSHADSLNTNQSIKAPAPADPAINPKGAGGRKPIIADTNVAKIHWSQLPEHFPVPTESIIQLPTGKPKVIPKVQHDFKAETPDEKIARQEKQTAVKDTFLFSWAGYKKQAWMQDELAPVTGKYKNPFCSWGATLVDSLDTLWMMGLNEEFEEAVESVKEIDFTTSTRNDLPLFEVVIRYLGGLVAAYDISGGAYRILLDKAVELADVLMGAFDTPNRMPMTFYPWKPTFASQPHRAKTRVVLAELGSLSVEFTRLAQLTKEAKYYDAVARITNEFEVWQNDTKLPGLFPMKVDASGCKKPDPADYQNHNGATGATAFKPIDMVDESASTKSDLHEGGLAKEEGSDEDLPGAESTVSEKSMESAQKPAAIDKHSTPDKPEIVGKEPTKNSTDTSPPTGAVGKRDVSDEDSSPVFAPKMPECEPQGLASPPFSNQEEFGIGGQADSTYEYLPKEYILLGGLEEKYRTLYETFADATTENLLFRAMIPDEDRVVLHAGLAKVSSRDSPFKLTPEGTHLTCFAGGMYALGAKVFEREEDMEIAKQLTDGCVWAYESTTTGIMPESYLAVNCEDMEHCPWNETLWHEELDPYGKMREKQRLHAQQDTLRREKELADREALQNKKQEEKDVTAEAEYAASEEPGAETVKESVNGSEAKGEKQEGKKALAAETEEKAEMEDVDVSHGAKRVESTDEFEEDIETTSGGAELSQQKADQAVSKPAAEKPIDSEQEKAEKAVSKPLAGAVETQEPLDDDLDEDVEMSDSKPIEGAAPPKQRLKRQLGMVDETHPATAASATLSEPGAVRVAKEKALAPPMSASSDSEVESVKAGEIPEKGEIGVKSTDSHVSGEDTKPINDTTKVAIKPTVKTNVYSPPSIPTQEEFVAERIKKERLPMGMTKITGGRYLLRPEAIESVFILWRATGDVYWREKGWAMFESVQKYTNATYGGSAIKDVTAEKPVLLDEMESFWLAETLKYFYLLFSEPTLVSLDDYVLNTEAHAFKRPT